MTRQNMLMLPIGLLLTVGTLGCGEKPAPVAEPGPVAGPEPVTEEPRLSPVEPEAGRDEAVALIEKLGGEVGYDEESSDRPEATVRLTGTKVTDAHLVLLKGLTSLENLDLRDTQVTDAGLEHLKGLTNLTFLGLSGTKVTDAGLEHLRGLTNLFQLDLSHTQVTDAGVNELAKALPNCRISR